MLDFLKTQARSFRGLNTIPGIIALFFWFLSLTTLWVDRAFPEFASSQPFRLFYTDYDTAKSVLSTVAAASITTLGLVYSIVLVVFTTAAGNIGPRLLQRFTGDPVNQFTAGLFGGTFLFALTVLHQTDSSFVPAFSIAMTFLLAGLSVLQLIYFVHTASASVTVDEEVAEIAGQMERDIDSLVGDDEDRDDYKEKPPEENALCDRINARAAGYITYIDKKALIAVAKDHDLFINLSQGHGTFIVSGIELARMSKETSGKKREKLSEGIHDAIIVSNSRSPESDVEFSTNLLIEIALRALSPGVNDTFTAVACVDRMSSALVRPVKHGLRDNIRADEDSIPRLYVPGLSLADLINSAFHPLRRASSGNVLMSKHILDALGRLYIIGDDDARRILNKHAELIVASNRKAGLLKADMDFLVEHQKQLFAPKKK